MWDFIKQLFKEKEEVQETKKETVALPDIELWLKNKEKEHKRLILEEIKPDLNQFNSELKRMDGDLEKLKSAQLRNKNISNKEIHFLDGNKKAYLKRASQFIKSSEAPDKFSSLKGFIERFKSILDDFSKSTVKQYQIISQFHAHEVREIALHIKQLETIFQRIEKELSSSDIDKFTDLIKEVDSLFYKLKEHEDKRNKLIAKQSLLEKRKEELTIKKEELHKINESPAYKEIEEQKKTLKDIEEEKRRLEYHIINYFSHVPLKKRARIDDNPIIKEYESDPVKALISDFDLKILDILNDIKKSIETNSMDLKEAKRRKALESISNLDISFLKGVINQLNEVAKKNIAVTEMIESNKNYIRKSRCENAIRLLDQEINDIKDEVIGIQEFIEKLQADEVKKDFERKISNLTKIDVKLRG